MGSYESEKKAFEFASKLFPGGNQRTPEADLMDWADDVTYSVHDLEDFYRAGRLPLHLLSQRDPREREYFFTDVFERRNGDKDFSGKQDLKEAFTDVLVSTFSIPGAYNGSADHRAALRNFTGTLIGRYINAVTVQEASTGVQVRIEPDLRAEVTMLKELVWTYVIEAASLAAQQHGHSRVIEELFEIYSDASQDRSDWRIFPTYYREWLEQATDETERFRTCVDLIASMTESQAIAMHHRLTGESQSSGLEDIVS